MQTVIEKFSNTLNVSCLGLAFLGSITDIFVDASQKQVKSPLLI